MVEVQKLGFPSDTKTATSPDKNPHAAWVDMTFGEGTTRSMRERTLDAEFDTEFMSAVE